MLAAGGPSPAAFADRLARNPDARSLEGFRYRFNDGRDVAALLAAAGHLRALHGSLGARFAALLTAEEDGQRQRMQRKVRRSRNRCPGQHGLKLRSALQPLHRQTGVDHPARHDAEAATTQTARRLRPLARRALMTARPPRVFMRTKKPWVRARRILEGW